MIRKNMNKKMNSHVRSKCSSKSFFIVLSPPLLFGQLSVKYLYKKVSCLSSTRVIAKQKLYFYFPKLYVILIFVKYLLSVLDYIMLYLYL